ncbi:hypothetical protein AAG570_006462 [Ranatra chinensis]|uniref:Uncharacterized protein n=1 Tax=Ranatra chinensis TaxID=642074 RepID=A0ABD0ZFB4_9HEMI
MSEGLQDIQSQKDGKLHVPISVVYASCSLLESGASEVTDLLHQGMTFYLEEPNWKRCFDKLHQTKRCCGVFGVDDWLSARCLVDDDGGILGKTLPASCCSPYANQPCVHDLLQQQHNSTVIGTLIRPPERDVNTMSFYSSVYRRGCARDLLEPIQQDAVFFITVLIIIDVLHVSCTKLWLNVLLLMTIHHIQQLYPPLTA